MYFEIYPQSSGLLSSQWRWRLKSANHEPIASGESYVNENGCLHAIGLLMDTYRQTPVYKVER